MRDLASPVRALVVIALTLLAACSGSRDRQLDRRFGQPVVRERSVATTTKGGLDYVTLRAQSPIEWGLLDLARYERPAKL